MAIDPLYLDYKKVVISNRRPAPESCSTFFLSEALVGEYLQFLWCTTLIPMVYSRHILFSLFFHTLIQVQSLFLTMPSYMTLTVLALAAFTVSPALSAPVQYDGLRL